MPCYKQILTEHSFFSPKTLVSDVPHVGYMSSWQIQLGRFQFIAPGTDCITFDPAPAGAFLPSPCLRPWPDTDVQQDTALFPRWGSWPKEEIGQTWFIKS